MDRRKILLVVAVVVAALGAGLVFVYAQGAEDRAQDKIADGRRCSSRPADDPARRVGLRRRQRRQARSRRTCPPTRSSRASTDDGADVRRRGRPDHDLPGRAAGDPEVRHRRGDRGRRPARRSPRAWSATRSASTTSARVGGFTQPGSRVGAIITGTFAGPTPSLLAAAARRRRASSPPGADTDHAGRRPPTSTPTATRSRRRSTAPVNQYVIAVEPRDDPAARPAPRPSARSSCVLLPARRQAQGRRRRSTAGRPLHRPETC